MGEKHYGGKSVTPLFAAFFVKNIPCRVVTAGNSNIVAVYMCTGFYSRQSALKGIYKCKVIDIEGTAVEIIRHAAL